LPLPFPLCFLSFYVLSYRCYYPADAANPTQLPDLGTRFSKPAHVANPTQLPNLRSSSAAILHVLQKRQQVATG
jgi:hypothetical protein